MKRFQGPNTRLLDHRGKVVLLNFWATWCGPCRQEMPILMQLQEKFAESGLIVMGINTDTNLREV
ncbi:MAG: TlpA family protein disulfide reductase, partial [Pseudomonadales bacterium]|nr:TlpA family protein disulfide reductase [Pseudomonadales bacterium]